MSLPTLRVAIGTAAPDGIMTLDEVGTDGQLDTAVLAENGINVDWADITEYVRVNPGVTINRGGTQGRGPYFRAEAGQVSFTLDNRDGRFDPFNLETSVSGEEGTEYGEATYGDAYGATSYYGTGSPFLDDQGRSLLRPGLPVSVQATHDGVTYDLFTGFVSTWLVEYPEAGIDSIARVTAHDAIGRLSRSQDVELGDFVGEGEAAGDRIARVLDYAGWYSSLRDIATDTPEQLIGTVHDRPAWDEMVEASDSVNGYLWVRSDSTVAFKTKSQFPRTPEFSFGVGDDVVPTRTVQVSNDFQQLFNVIKLSNEDGAEVQVTDADSIDLYGKFSHDASGLPLLNDTDVAASATHLLSQFKDLRLRVEGFHVPMKADSSDVNWARMLGLDVLRRVTGSFVTPDGRTVTREGLVRGVELRIGPTLWEWSVSTTQAPEALGVFELDNVSLGVLDTHTLAAF